MRLFVVSLSTAFLAATRNPCPIVNIDNDNGIPRAAAGAGAASAPPFRHALHPLWLSVRLDTQLGISHQDGQSQQRGRESQTRSVLLCRLGPLRSAPSRALPHRRDLWLRTGRIRRSRRLRTHHYRTDRNERSRLDQQWILVGRHGIGIKTALARYRHSNLQPLQRRRRLLLRRHGPAHGIQRRHTSGSGQHYQQHVEPQ